MALKWPIVFSKRLGSRGFHDFFIQYIFSFHKHYEYCKTGPYEICVNFSGFLSHVNSLVDFYEYKMGLNNGGKPFNFEVVMTYIRSTKIRAQKNNDSL